MEHAGKSLSRQVDVRRALGQLALFQPLDAARIDAVARLSTPIRLAKGEHLFDKGQLASAFYVIVSGQIKLALPFDNNNERVIDLPGPGQCFGEALLFLDRPYPVYAQALVKALVISVPGEALFDLLASEPRFALHLLADMSMRLHHLVLDIETYSKQTSTQRLVSFILQHLPAALSPDDGSGVIEFELPDKKLLIASRLCLAPETLSRSLQELRDKNLIDIKGRLIVIKNFAGLRDYR